MNRLSHYGNANDERGIGRHPVFDRCTRCMNNLPVLDGCLVLLQRTDGDGIQEC